MQDYRDHLKSVRLQTRQNAAAAPIHAQSVSVKGGREEMSGLQEETHRREASRRQGVQDGNEQDNCALLQHSQGGLSQRTHLHTYQISLLKGKPRPPQNKTKYADCDQRRSHPLCCPPTEPLRSESPPVHSHHQQHQMHRQRQDGECEAAVAFAGGSREGAQARRRQVQRNGKGGRSGGGRILHHTKVKRGFLIRQGWRADGEVASDK